MIALYCEELGGNLTFDEVWQMFEVSVVDYVRFLKGWGGGMYYDGFADWRAELVLEKVDQGKVLSETDYIKRVDSVFTLF